ncbi:MAG: DUF4198 domain-containing protein [Gemmataceae bacterium]|nr:DUF4198 domain-containing protein [Gemmataceae bacterium]
MFRVIASAVTLTLLASAGSAHYNMLLPSKPWAEKGEKVTFTYQFGHPYEHELVDAPKPLRIGVIKPNGLREGIVASKSLMAIKNGGAEGKKVVVWQFDYTPAERGDHIFLLRTPPIDHGDGITMQDRVRVVLHVQTQKGWDVPVGDYDSGLDLWPYTRPYGLLPGMVFKGRILWLPFKDAFEKRSLDGVDGLHVEIEKYNPKPPKNLPPDELITFRTKTGPNGFFVTTLPESGWWGITATTARGMKTKSIQRATHWVHVDEKK